MESESRGRLHQFRCIFPQIVATLIASQSYLSIGLIRAWASTSVPSLNLQELHGVENEWALDQAPLGPDLISWIVSTPPLGAIVGSLISSLPLNYLGRKPSLYISGFMFLLAYGLISIGGSVESSVPLILCGRILCGVAVGISCPAAVIYISEITQPSLRGTFGCIPALMLALGVLLGYVGGSFLSWTQLSYASLAPPSVLLAGLLFLPESPVWLKKSEKHAAALKAMIWLNLRDRSNSSDSDGRGIARQSDMKGLETYEHTISLEELKTNGDVRLEKHEEYTDYIRNHDNQEGEDINSFLSVPVLYPLFLSMMLMFLQNWSGVNVLIFKTVEIFTAVGSSVDDYVATAVVGGVQLLATGCSTMLVDKAGRRSLLIISSIVMWIAMSGLGTCFYLGESLPENLGWFPLLTIILAFIGYSVGFAGIPFLIMGELFPSRYRNICGSISSTFNLTMLFLLLKFFTSMVQSTSFHCVFWLYAGINFVGAWFVFFLLPETKGRDLKEIEALFSKRGKNLHRRRKIFPK